MRTVVTDLLNAARLVFAPNAFVAAEQKHIEAVDATRSEDVGVAGRVSLVRQALLRSASLVGIAFAMGWLWAEAVGLSGYALRPNWQVLLQALSAATLLWGTLFLRGWEIQTFSGMTLTERVNQTLYRVLCTVGTVVGVFATLCPTVNH
ncbi:hypothetical protein [Caballeronia grimmiae]|uniref:Transmembrane protein n=1 Tax=Caballeronia grimmiae TaxID=1071679 RepID=A0A069NBA2_9BURK|nr:hypothetical protein [Caballeronia grimmiae]KDR25397.1 hypothetical protein BG57_30590 [Caballeronia grimmiae]GGD98272.1 hypothetical protein GCM10010985_61280 [Caballeronia grimmiae]